MRILVVEDETRMAALIRQGLEEEAYAVDVVGNGAEVLDWVESARYDIILLDIMLPGMDGLNVCRLLRAKGYTQPILMLTARDTLPDKVQGLDSGADDYLVKPFAIEELTARLRALARREGPSKTPELRVGDLVLDTATKRARRGDVPLEELTAKEYALLETLLRHPNQVLTRDQIMEAVRGRELDAFDRSIDVHMGRIRAAIEQDPKTPKRILTVRGVGYVFARQQD